MTLLVTVILGTAALLIVSSIENQSLQTVIGGILSGSHISAAPEPSSQVPENPNQTPPEPGKQVSEKAWYLNTQSQQYGQALTGVVNTGLDIATPFHTNITSLTGGKVVQAYYSPQIGGQVVVQFQSAGKTLYAAYVHLDEIAVQVGQTISVGTFLGLSGGQTSGGSHPAQYPYSTGPHTLFGIFTANITDFSHSINPKPFFDSIVALLSGAKTQ